MPLFQDLLRTYEQEKDSDVFKEKIAPIAHEYGKADIQLTITEEGEFVSATAVEKGKEETLLAVTEESQSRTGRDAKNEPQAVNDKLKYIAKDMDKHFNPSSEERGESVSYIAYKEQMEGWCRSEYSHPKARAILRYIEGHDVIEDLIKAGVVKADQNGMLVGTSMEKTVRFCVLSEDGTTPNTWEDVTMFDSWTSYYTKFRENNGNVDLDGVTGRVEDVPTCHPKKVLPGAANAKLISISTSENALMHFIGERFTDESQRLQVGYDTSQKVHNTLRWLIDTQSITISAGNSSGSKKVCPRYMICWDPSFNNSEIYDVEMELFAGSRVDNEFVSGREHLNKAIYYGTNSSQMETGLTVAAFDSAIPGRFTMVYYQKMMAREFFNRLDEWYEKCSWYFGNRDNATVSSPSIFMLARCAFGIERDDKKSSYLDIDGKLFKETIQDIVAHVLNGQPLPEHIVRALVTQASEPMRFDVYHDSILRTACAAVRQRLLVHKQGGEANMKLNKESTDRSYLFGRILAVEDAIEQTVLDRKENGTESKRETNARRLWSAYVNHPMTTWQELKNLLLPYEAQLSVGSRVFYQKTMEEIVSKFEDTDMSSLARSNRVLDPQYLLGFYLQRRELRKGRKKDYEDSLTRENETTVKE